MALAFATPAVICRPAEKNRVESHEFALMRMGTIFRIVLYGPSRDAASRAAMAAFDRIERLEDILSDYREHSELRRLCRNGPGAARNVSPELFFVLDNSLRISRLSGGAFDVTIGPLSSLWREARKLKRLPDPAAVRQARESVGYENIILDEASRTVTLVLPDMRIDLGGIAKGYAAEQALAVLKSRGFPSALVDAGGDISIGAAPPGKTGWQIAIRDPGRATHEPPGYLVLSDLAIATSGDEFQHLDLYGRRYSHIINPADGMGVTDAANVTVIARDGTTADALATALSIMPAAEGIRLIESIEGASAAIVRRAGNGFERILSLRFPRPVTMDPRPAGRSTSLRGLMSRNKASRSGETRDHPR